MKRRHLNLNTMALCGRSSGLAFCVAFCLALMALISGCPDPDVGPGPGDTDTSLFSPAHCGYETAPTPASSVAGGPGKVMAGVGEAPIDLPVGTPLGGYTARISLLGG